jgi:hypothetical protein
MRGFHGVASGRQRDYAEAPWDAAYGTDEPRCPLFVAPILGTDGGLGETSCSDASVRRLRPAPAVSVPGSRGVALPNQTQASSASLRASPATSLWTSADASGLDHRTAHKAEFPRNGAAFA